MAEGYDDEDEADESEEFEELDDDEEYGTYAGFEESVDLDEAVATFLADAEVVYDEYEQGYMDADAALNRLAGHVEQLRAEYEDD